MNFSYWKIIDNIDSVILNNLFSSIPSTSPVQDTCFERIPIFKSNSPYIIQEKGDHVCVRDKRSLSLNLSLIYLRHFHLDVEANEENYRRLINQELHLNSSILSRSINLDNSVSSPLGTPTELTAYRVNFHSDVLWIISWTN